jgi:hypothetical protein
MHRLSPRDRFSFARGWRVVKGLIGREILLQSTECNHCLAPVSDPGTAIAATGDSGEPL